MAVLLRLAKSSKSLTQIYADLRRKTKPTPSRRQRLESTLYFCPKGLKITMKLCLYALLACGAWHAAHAQSYPTRPIRLVASTAVGSGSDVVSRLLVPRVTEVLGQQVIVDNRPGAICTELLAKAPPDGHTLVLLGAGTHVINALLVKNLPYDSIKDFAPIATVQRSDYVLVVHPSFTKFAEIIKAANIKLD